MSHIYRIVVEQVNPDEWAATTPALPGCVGRGDSLDEVLSNTHEAIERHLEELSDHDRLLPLECLPNQREFVMVVDPLLKPPGRGSGSIWSVGRSRSRSTSSQSTTSGFGTTAS